MITVYFQFERVAQRREPHECEFGARDESHLREPPPILRPQSYRGNTAPLACFQRCQVCCLQPCLVSMKQRLRLGWSDESMKQRLTYLALPAIVPLLKLDAELRWSV